MAPTCSNENCSARCHQACNGLSIGQTRHAKGSGRSIIWKCAQHGSGIAEVITPPAPVYEQPNQSSAVGKSCSVCMNPIRTRLHESYPYPLIHVSICCSEPFCSHSIENIDISPENSSISNQNLNHMNSSNKETDCFTEPKTFRFKNPKNLIMGHLNVNSLRNKFESIKLIISPNFDIFLVSETKLDESFPNNQFSISSYRMFRQDRNCFGGGLCIYVKENIASK